MRFALLWAVGGVCAIVLCFADSTASRQPVSHSKQSLRPISLSEGVLAIYYNKGGLFVEDPGPAIVIAIWVDGTIVWSDDPLRGGPPYHLGQVDRRKACNLLARIEADGIFDDPIIAQGWLLLFEGNYTTILIRSGKQSIEIASSHESVESNGQSVVTTRGSGDLEGPRRLDVIRSKPRDYLYFRFVWSDIVSKAYQLIPSQGKVTHGFPSMTQGELSWHIPNRN